MTARYLLDTNILSDLIRHPGGRVAQRIVLAGANTICTSIVVAAEMRYGAAKKNAPILTARVDALLGTLDVLPLEPPTDVTYGLLRANLERAGVTIGPNDLLIAAQALASKLVLVTDNEREFSRVADLSLENWLR